LTEETTALEELETEPTEPVVEEDKTEESEEKTEEKAEGDDKPKPKENRYSKTVKKYHANWREEQRKSTRLQKELDEIKEAKKLKKAPEADDYEDGVVPDKDKKQWDNQTREEIREEERNRIKQENHEKKQQKKWDDGRDQYVKARPAYLKEDPEFGSYERKIDDAVHEWKAPEIQNIIIESKELGPAIVSHFGKNPDELLDIASASPQKRFFKMGQLITKLEAKPVKKTSSAPPPPRSERGSAKTVNTNSKNQRGKNETHLEYARRVNGL
jgi:hypothetical protein